MENCLEAIRRERVARGAAGAKLDMNHVWVTVWPVVDLDLDALGALGTKISPLTDGAGVEEVVAQGRWPSPAATPLPMAVRFSAQPGSGVVSTVEEPPNDLLAPLDDYASKVVRVAPPRARLPLRAERRADRSWRHARGARPRRHPASSCRSTGPTASTRPASSRPS